MNTSILATNDKFPKFIRNNPTVKKFVKDKSPKKFADLGILDFSAPYTHKCDVTDEEILKRLGSLLSSRSISIAGNCLSEIPTVAALIPLLTVKNCKFKNELVLPSKLTFSSLAVKFKKGENILYLINWLLSFCEGTEAGDKLESIGSDAIDLELSKYKNLKFVFSTKPWDIATMSMRGIKSCQGWSSSHRSCLIGSVVDPYMGVAYITDGKTFEGRGPRMLVRSVVRLVNARPPYSSLREPVLKSSPNLLYIEEPYIYHRRIKFTSLTVAMNKGFRKKYPRKKFANNPNLSYYIPNSPLISELRRNQLSYRDSHLAYC